MVGGPWYNVLFKKAWMRENSFTEADLKKRNISTVFASSMGITYLFENRSRKLFLINAGYHIVLI